jgi:hypothetical protein
MADDNSSDNSSDILQEFGEFLKQREEAQRSEQSAQDDEIEIWDEKGRGARVRRSVAKPFLNSLGIDLDSPEGDDSSDSKSDDSGKNKSGRPRQSKSTAATQGSTVRKYFVKK